MAIALTSIAGNGSATGSTIAMTVPAGGVPAGSLIVVTVIENNTTGTIGTINDTSDNIYTKITDLSPNAANANGRAAMFYCKNCQPLVSGNLITYNKITTGVSVMIDSFYATGVDTAAPLDTAVTATSSASSSTPTVTSGTPSVAGELFVAAVFRKGSTTFTQDTTHGWAAPPNPASSSTHGSAGGSQVNAGTGTKIYSPTLGTSLVNCQIVAGFKAAASSTLRRVQAYFSG
jgi:hypothetical protein